MTNQVPNGAPPPDSDADRLGDAWNEIVAGRVPIVPGEDGLVRTVRSLHAGAPVAHPDPAFRHQLREQLMETAIPASTPFGKQAVQPASGRLVPPGSGSKVEQTVPAVARRWLTIAATLALLLATAAGGYFGAIRGNDGGNSPATMYAAAPSDATPVSGTPEPYQDPCEGMEPYLPCGTNPWIGQALITGKGLADTIGSVSKVQMQGWELEGGRDVTFSAQNPTLVGVGTDVVISGAYMASFSAPVTVSRPVPGGGASFEYPDANTVIELSRGDAVTYPLGTKLTLGNPLAYTRLQFKSILFYEGDPSPDTLGAGGIFQSRVDGEGTLPAGTWDNLEGGIYVMVTYQNKGIPPLPDDAPIGWVLGPVASTLIGGSPDEGFVVWVSWARG